ncbi:MAG: hypothetical protein ACRETY_06610 [Steroidobacteraceae bacterium]
MITYEKNIVKKANHRIGATALVGALRSASAPGSAAGHANWTATDAISERCATWTYPPWGCGPPSVTFLNPQAPSVAMSSAVVALSEAVAMIARDACGPG